MNTLLQPHRQWQVDIEQLESLADARTTAVVVNNPSNPCGSVYSKAHLADIAAVAERHGIVVVADEIYGELVFEGSTFESMASTSPKARCSCKYHIPRRQLMQTQPRRTQVPVFTTTGLSKRFLVPGWRVGWLVLHAGGRDVTEVRRAVKVRNDSLHEKILLDSYGRQCITLPSSLWARPWQFRCATLRIAFEVDPMFHRACSRLRFPGY